MFWNEQLHCVLASSRGGVCRISANQAGKPRRSPQRFFWPGDKHPRRDRARPGLEDWSVAAHRLLLRARRHLMDAHTVHFLSVQEAVVILSRWRQTTSDWCPVPTGSSTNTMWTLARKWTLAVCATSSFSSIKNYWAPRTALTGQRCSYPKDCTKR